MIDNMTSVVGPAADIVQSVAGAVVARAKPRRLKAELHLCTSPSLVAGAQRCNQARFLDREQAADVIGSLELWVMLREGSRHPGVFAKLTWNKCRRENWNPKRTVLIRV